jgi:hypothetical protein
MNNNTASDDEVSGGVLDVNPKEFSFGGAMAPSPVTQDSPESVKEESTPSTPFQAPPLKLSTRELFVNEQQPAATVDDAKKSTLMQFILPRPLPLPLPLEANESPVKAIPSRTNTSENVPKPTIVVAKGTKKSKKIEQLILADDWATNPKCLKRLVRANLTAYLKENHKGVHQFSPTIEKVIAEIINLPSNRRPRIIIYPENTQVETKDITRHGKHHRKMVAAIRESFLHTSIRNEEDDTPTKTESALLETYKAKRNKKHSKFTVKITKQAATTTTTTLQTPDRKKNTSSSNKREAEKTPVMDNTKKQRTTKVIHINNNNHKTDVKATKNKCTTSLKQQDGVLTKNQTRERDLGEIPKPVVYVEELTYDWSSLGLDGTAAWNRRLLEQRSHHDHCSATHSSQKTQPVELVQPMDTYRVMKDLKDSLRTILPPKDSPLHDALLRDHQFSFSTDAEKFHRMRLSSTAEPPIIPPPDCPPELKDLYPNLAQVYRGMIAQDCMEEDTLLRRKYQYMTATELQEYLKSIELDVAALENKEERIRTSSQQLLGKGAFLGRESQLESKDIEKSMPPKTLYWHPNLASLLRMGGEAARYLKAHDQY